MIRPATSLEIYFTSKNAKNANRLSMSFAVLTIMNDQRDIAKSGFRSGGGMKNAMRANIFIRRAIQMKIAMNLSFVNILLNMADVLAAIHATK
jgi:hypothetical protein